MKNKELNLNKEYLNRNEAQMYLGISESAFDKLVKRYSIPCAKIPGTKVLFRRIDLKRLIELFMNAPEDIFPPSFDRNI